MRTLRRGAEAVRGGGAASSSLPYAAVQPPPLRALPFGAAAAGAEAIGTETRPLYMQMLEPTFKARQTHHRPVTSPACRSPLTRPLRRRSCGAPRARWALRSWCCQQWAR